MTVLQSIFPHEVRPGALGHLAVLEAEQRAAVSGLGWRHQQVGRGLHLAKQAVNDEAGQEKPLRQKERFSPITILPKHGNKIICLIG